MCAKFCDNQSKTAGAVVMFTSLTKNRQTDINQPITCTVAELIVWKTTFFTQLIYQAQNLSEAKHYNSPCSR